MEPIVIEARPLANYRVWLRFEDGTSGEADLSHLAGKGLFECWGITGEFEKLSVDEDSGTIVWPGGLDVAPDTLYERVRSWAASRAS